jgi:hypothetical protein
VNRRGSFRLRRSPPGAAAVLQADFELPADAEGELVISLSVFDTSCGGLQPPPTAVLVDELRVESPYRPGSFTR